MFWSFAKNSRENNGNNDGRGERQVWLLSSFRWYMFYRMQYSVSWKVTAFQSDFPTYSIVRFQFDTLIETAQANRVQMYACIYTPSGFLHLLLAAIC